MERKKNPLPIELDNTALKLILGAVVITLVVVGFTLAVVVIGVFTLSLIVIYSYRYSLKIIIQIKLFVVDFINSIIRQLTHTKQIIIDGTIKKEGQ